jgi:hypothetical protein
MMGFGFFEDLKFSTYGGIFFAMWMRFGFQEDFKFDSLFFWEGWDLDFLRI